MREQENLKSLIRLKKQILEKVIRFTHVISKITNAGRSTRVKNN